jgi:predicted RNase H-like nuclease (RuvC/YqgF family)
METQVGRQRDFYQRKVARRDASIERLEGSIAQKDCRIHDLEQQLQLARSAIKGSTSSSSSSSGSSKRARSNTDEHSTQTAAAAHHMTGNANRSC